MGHAVAVTDAPAACFAPELIEAYPDAKVVLNLRRDLDAWQRSVLKNIAQACLESWPVWLLSRFNTELFWVYTLYAQYLWPRLFRCVGLSSTAEITSNARSIYRGKLGKRSFLGWFAQSFYCVPLSFTFVRLSSRTSSPLLFPRSMVRV